MKKLHVRPASSSYDVITNGYDRANMHIRNLCGIPNYTFLIPRSREIRGKSMPYSV